jgi:hypothetical protein
MYWLVVVLLEEMLNSWLHKVEETLEEAAVVVELHI